LACLGLISQGAKSGGKILFFYLFQKNQAEKSLGILPRLNISCSGDEEGDYLPSLR
jgi:hypothetical protein